MSGGDDWAPGDLALCVNGEQNWICEHPVRTGCVYTVATAFMTMCGVGLTLEEVEHPMAKGYRASRFRKINPLTDEERDEFLADLNVPVREVRHG